MSRTLLLSFALLTFTSCKTAQNFTEKDQPIWKRFESVNETITTDSTLTIVSYNIEYGRNIDEAFFDLSTDSIIMSDIILLQEMDELGTIKLSERLDYNYVYYPISFHTKHNQNFGNAILSKWPIVSSEKIILAEEQPLNNLKRGATSALIQYGSTQIKVYSIHMETVVMWLRKRLKQLQSALNHIEEGQAIEHVIFGGDFNSMFPKDVKKMVALMDQEGFDWSSKEVGHSVQVLGILKPTIDHIFSKGFKVIESGKIENAKASDHVPIWVKLSMK